MNWNPVLNKFIEIKNEYLKKYPEETLFLYADTKYEKSQHIETCLEYWVRKLGKQEYIDLIKPLQLTEYNNKLLVRYGNYSDIFSGEEDITMDSFWELHDGFYQECRSVVIDIKTDELVLTPFRKFRNLGECEETSLENIKERIHNATSVEFSDKLDGSMQSGRYYKGSYLLAGSQSLDQNNSWRLEDGYQKLTNNHKEMLKDNPDKTFIFEYISLKDAHVVNYKKEQEGLYLIGIREVDTGKEYSYKDVLEYATKYHIPTTTIFETDLSRVLSSLDSKKSDEAEGFVVNIDGYKVKIKYNDYVKMHHILSEITSPKLIIESIAENRFDDFYSKIPTSHKNRIEKVAKQIFQYVSDLEKDIHKYYALSPSPNMQKDVPNLYILVGLSGSGKSSLAKKIEKEEGAVIISSDAIRKELYGDESIQKDHYKVFEIYQTRIKEELSAGKNVIADATNITIKARKYILDSIKKIPCNKVAIVIPKSFADCVIDNVSRDRVVPYNALKKQQENFEIPFKEEGFDEIKIGLSKNKQLCVATPYYKNILKRMDQFNQQNPHHNETLGNHSKTTTEEFLKHEKYRGTGYELGSRIHDIGKLYTQTFDEKGIAHYYFHGRVGAYELVSHFQELLEETNLTKEELLDAIFLVNYHMKPFTLETEKAHNKWKNIFGEEKYQMLMDFHECDKFRKYEKELEIENQEEIEYE